MKRFSSDEIVSFLKALDQTVAGPFEVEIIGGAAGILLYNLDAITEDIDTITSVSAIADAIQEARSITGLSVPIGPAGVWDGPYEYRSRRLPVNLPGSSNLMIYVPEKHDWALMKIVRLKDKDRQHILGVMKTEGFDAEVFLKRFLEEMTHVIGHKPNLIYNFIVMMGELFGEQEALRMASAIKSHKYWQE